MVRRFAAYLMLCLGLVSCSGWLDVRPYDAISEQDLTSTPDGFKKLLNGVYIELCREELYGLSLGCEMVEIMGGAYEIGSDANVWGEYVDLANYDYRTEYWRMRLDGVWNKAYSLILDCNKIISLSEGKESLFASGEYEIIKGEAYALRAMLHFDMLRLFGPVFSLDAGGESIPYYDGITLVPNERLSASDALTAVVLDLLEARKLLGNDPVIGHGPMMESSPDGDNFLRYRAFRLNYYAVTALLARAYMWAGDKDSAFSYASEVMEASDAFPFVSRTDVIGTDDPDRIFSSEVLFALNTTERTNLFLDYFSPSRTTFTLRMESSLNNDVIFGGAQTTGGYQDDYRNRAGWGSSGANRYCYKFAPMAQSGDLRSTMIPLIRIGEMYLIAAECRGVSYLNALRKSRGISQNLTDIGENILEYEYVRELYAEGQLFFMYKRRYGDIIRSATPSKNVRASEDVFVIPLPDTERMN